MYVVVTGMFMVRSICAICNTNVWTPQRSTLDLACLNPTWGVLDLSYPHGSEGDLFVLIGMWKRGTVSTVLYIDVQYVWDGVDGRTVDVLVLCWMYVYVG